MTSEAFYASKSMAKQVNSYLTDFADFSFTNKRYLSDSGIDVNYPKTLVRQSREALDAIYEFERNFLGNGTPEDGDLRPVAFVF